MMLALHVLADPDATAAIVAGHHTDPCAFLGLHALPEEGHLVVRTFQPGAERVDIVLDDERRIEMTRIAAAGVFAAALPPDLQHRPAYRFHISWATGLQIVDDPYRFGTQIADEDLWHFVRGEHDHLYDILGANHRQVDGVGGTLFAVWAPNARRVSVIGDFNGWDGRRHPMRLRHTGGVWELFVPQIPEGTRYKFELINADGHLLPLKADPFGRSAELRPQNASVVVAPSRYTWHDAAWLEERDHATSRERPISIYEVHLGSWRRNENGSLPTYKELTETLLPYVVEQGFTHIELLPITEYPFDGSWGYQPIGLFAPTRRFGTPDDLRFFIDRAHQAGIGVLLDWVPGHFPLDEHGLSAFDGTSLYEHADPRQGFHPDWGTGVFNYGRPEVVNYLVASALFWLREFHFDGLRVDAVASMLYLDYSRKEGEWVPNAYGGRENLEAIAFLRRLNERAHSVAPGVLMIAEESTAFPGVSAPTWCNGLGFGYKWNMGWMHDSLVYFGRESVYRTYHQDEITFSMVYSFSENYVLPLSHDEVVHGKGSLLARMPGDAWQQFANLRTLYAYQFAHPGKKLLFMGSEFAQGMEWSCERDLDWFLLDYPQHEGVAALVRDLNHLYRSVPALHEYDVDPRGFSWIDIADAQASVISFIRFGKESGSYVVVVCNFTPVVREEYRIGVPEACQFRTLLNSDERRYGGSGTDPGRLHADAIESHGRPASLALRLPPLGVLILEPVLR